MSGVGAKSVANYSKDGEDFWKEGRGEILSDLGSLINRPEGSDVVFECNDGIHIYASRWLLANRCSVFKSLLSNGMLESNLSVVLLPKFSSPVVLSIMEFLYTGAIDSYYPSSWKLGFELISAGQFFIIPAVEKFAQKFIWTNAQLDGATDKTSVVEMLSIALNFQEAWEDKDKMLQNFVDYIGPDWSDADCCCKLSRNALEYILSNSEQIVHTEEIGESMEEYFTFWNIVQWHVYQTFPVGDMEAKARAKAALQRILPKDETSSLRRRMLQVPADVNSRVDTKSNRSTSVDSLNSISEPLDSLVSSSTLSTLLGTSVHKESLVELLSHINLSLIPAPLLLRVIHPLRIIPSQQLLVALLNINIAMYRRRSPTRFD